MIRVLVVDDSTFVRKAVRRVLEGDPEIEVVGEADNGLKALELIVQLDPHVVALDIEMPGLDGYSTLCEIMRLFPRPVLMLSLHTQEGAELTMKCLEKGAVDFLDKSTYGAMDYHLLAAELQGKIHAAATLQRIPLAPPRDPAPAEGVTSIAPPVRLLQRGVLVGVLGASTGGPPILQGILSRLPKGYPVPLVVVQHMPRGFTQSFAARLDSLCSVEVREAQAGEALQGGTVLVAPAGRHLRIVVSGGRLRVQLSSHPAGVAHVPSIDETMSSAAAAVGAAALGVLLTGMGSDGAAGLAAMRQAGGMTLVQTPESCVAFGMPKAALDRSAAERALDPEGITALLLALTGTV